MLAAMDLLPLLADSRLPTHRPFTTAEARASGVGALYSCNESHVPQSGHLPIHFGCRLPQCPQRNCVRVLAIGSAF